MELSLGQAAKLAGVGKTTLARAIHSGKMSATRREDGTYGVDPAELTRVYPPKSEAVETESAAGYAAHRPPAIRNLDETDLRIQVASLSAELKALREVLEAEKRHTESEKRRADEIREDRDTWRGQAERLLLTAPVIVAGQPAAGEGVKPRPTSETTLTPPRRSWWPWAKSS
jgi:excisionase family DNA binding protein